MYGEQPTAGDHFMRKKLYEYIFQDTAVIREKMPRFKSSIVQAADSVVWIVQEMVFETIEILYNEYIKWINGHFFNKMVTYAAQNWMKSYIVTVRNSERLQ